MSEFVPTRDLNFEEETFPNGIDHEVFYNNLKAYSNTPNEYEKLIINHFNQEIQALKDYEGRELYELIQNVEDAGSSELRIELNGDRLVIANDGDHPFSVEGYGAIMRPYQSTKRAARYIGNKGLGFRSVLNWTHSFSICSLVAPRSKKGIRCSFSEKIAYENYERLMRKWRENGLTPRAEKMLEKEAANYGKRYPISILSVPNVAEWTPVEGVTTSIEMELNEEVIEDVKRHIEALKNSQIFLFIKNLRRIKIDVDGEFTEIECVRHDDAKLVEINIKGTGRETEIQKWIIEKAEEGRNSVAAARRVDVRSAETNHHDYYFHSFFPTLIKLGLGCVLHATVELNSNRNYVIKTEGKPFEMLADVVRRLGEAVRAFYDSNPTWDAYDVFVEKGSEGGNDAHFERFFKLIGEIRENESLVPTVGGRYLPCDDTVRVTEQFSRFASSLDFRSDAFEDVLLPGFEAENISANVNFPEHLQMLQQFANIPLERQIRVEYICLLQGIEWIALPDDGPLHLYTDKDGDLINDKAYLLTADQRQIPSIVKVRLIDDDLTKDLKRELAPRIEKIKEEEEKSGRKSNDDRRLYSLLHKISDIGYTDFSYIKNKLFSASKTQHTPAQDVEMIQYLLNHYENNRGRLERDEGPLTGDSILHLCHKNGAPRAICNLLYGETDGPWAPRITNWTEVLGLPSEKEETLRELLLDELHMGLKVPMVVDEWVKDNDYLRSVGGGRSSWNCDRREVRDKLKEEKLSPYAFILDSKYVSERPVSKLIHDLIDDSNAFRAVMNDNGGKFTVWYVKNTIPYADYNAMTPARFYLQKKLKGLSNYMVGSHKWLGEPLIDEDELSNAGKKRFEDIARAFGAKSEDSELSVTQIYEAISETNKKNHRNIYQRMKRALKAKDDRGEFVGVKSGLKVWASIDGRVLDEKIDCDKCYYADNTPPKAILERFPILDIGKREGVEQVTKYFGVRPVSEIDTRPVTVSATRLEKMENEFKDLLKKRAVYILAARCESFRDDTLKDSAVASYAQLKGLKFSVWDGLQYAIEIEGQEKGEIFTLEKGHFLQYGRKPSSDETPVYYLSTDNSNISANRDAVSAIASMLCSVFKLQETNWGERFYNILRLDVTDLDYRLSSDYPDEFVSVIKDVVAEKDINLRQTITVNADDFAALLEQLVYKKEIELYDLCLARGAEMQKDFLAKCDRIRDEAEKAVTNIIDNMRPFSTMDDIRAEISRKLHLADPSTVEKHEFPILDEYKDWLRENISLSTYDLMAYPDIQSLVFFPGNMALIEQLWADHFEKISKEKKELEAIKNNYVPSKLEARSEGDFRIEKPAATSGQRSNVERKLGRNGVSAQAKNVYGGNAEQDVRAYLEERGWEVHKRSSNLDPTMTDKYHYDLLVIDPDAVKHYVDAKYSSDGIVHISEAQYEFAKRAFEKNEHYDLYVIYEGQLHIIEDAFPKLELYTTPDSYRFRLRHN